MSGLFDGPGAITQACTHANQAVIKLFTRKSIEHGYMLKQLIGASIMCMTEIVHAQLHSIGGVGRVHILSLCMWRSPFQWGLLSGNGDIVGKEGRSYCHAKVNF